MPNYKFEFKIGKMM